ncbi:zinc finger, RING-type domain-containing protein [Endozoicomonas sp. 4G]|uniref:RING finger protein n=1 Tax=Endozoicomonas sp. 4G TaxID=2872754 RepID=UPI002078F04C|nr:zinc finger, RING-type domain-containing protein [Endozoicomonas sp. 4G]
MKRLLKSLFFFLPLIVAVVSVEAQITEGLTVYPLPDQASAITGSLVTLGVLALRQQTWQSLPYNPKKGTKPESYNKPIVHYSHEPKLSFPEYDLPDYRIFLQKQQAEMERIHKIAAEEMATGRVTIKIAEATTDEDTARRVYIAKTNGITVREQKDIEQEAKRHREDAHVQSDGSAMERPDIQLPDDSVLCLAATRKACREVLSKIVSCPNSEPDSTSENTSAPAQEGGQESDHTGEDGSAATEADSQQLLNQHLAGFKVMQTPTNNGCWLHAIYLSTGRIVSTLIPTLIEMIDNHLTRKTTPVQKKIKNNFPANEHSAFLLRWAIEQGEENVQLLGRQLHDNKWPDFNILLPLLSHLFEKTFVVVNLHASGLTQDQVFTYATSNHAQVTTASEASAINTPEATVYLGLLSRDHHFVGIQPDTQDENCSHSCTVCLDPFTKDSGIKSTSCFHYVCDTCFEELNQLNQPSGWTCPMCRRPQKYVKPPGSEPERTEDDTQRLLNRYLTGFEVIPTPADNFCWLHAIHFSADQNVSTLIQTLIYTIDDHFSHNEQAPETETSVFVSNWVNAQGEENVQLLRQQLHYGQWPDLSILLPLLSYLFAKTYVVVNLHASGLTQDQVFTYVTPNDVQVTIVSEASDINTSRETVYLGLLSRDNHYVGIRPDTRNNDHSCPVCYNRFTQSSGIKSTTCYHYLCDTCFDRLNQPPFWDCPLCLRSQEYVRPTEQPPSADQRLGLEDDYRQLLNELSRYAPVLEKPRMQMIMRNPNPNREVDIDQEMEMIMRNPNPNREVDIDSNYSAPSKG